MIRVLNTAEKNLAADAPAVFVIPAAGTVTTKVLNNESTNHGSEIAYRYVQNVGLNPCFYFIGQTITGTGTPPANYHGVIAAGAQLDCSNHTIDISVYSVAGTTVATTVIRRITSQSQATVGLNPV